MAVKKEVLNPKLEALKELGRLLLLSVVSFFLAEGMNAIATLLGYYVSPEVVLFATAFLTYMLKAIDKWLHELNKTLPVDEQNSGLLGAKGLTY